MRLPKILIFGVAALVLLANVASLVSYPMPHCDEVSHAVISANFLRDGSFSRDIMGPLNDSHQNVVVQGRIYHVVKALFQAIAGTSFLTTRLFSTLGWLTASGMVYLVGKRLYDVLTGALAAFLFATSLTVFYASHIGREEVWLIASVEGMLLLYLVLRDQPSRLGYFLFGLYLAAMLDIHPNAVWFSVPLAAFLIYENRRTPATILMTALGGMLGLMALVTIHMLPDPTEALRSLQLTAAANDLIGGALQGRLTAQVHFIRTTYFDAFNHAVIVFTLYALAGAAATSLRLWQDRLLMWISVVSMLLFAVGLAHKNPMYGVLWDPFLALLIAAGAVRAAKRITIPRLSLSPATLSTLLVAPLITFNLVSQFYLAVKFNPRDFVGYQAAIQDAVPSDATVLGDTTLWYAFRDRNLFVSDWVFLQMARLSGERVLVADALADAMNQIDAQVVVYDGSVDCSVDVTPQSKLLGAYLAEHCTETARIDAPYFGAGGQNASGQATIIYTCP
jgi:4-amino-4-deoxy-L-arabinose transferase-like glycosyltransferase